MTLIKYLIFSLLLNLNIYTPKFHDGDCIYTVFKNTEPWEIKENHHKINQVGNSKYWLDDERIYDFHYDISYIDSEYQLESCDKN